MHNSLPTRIHSRPCVSWAQLFSRSGHGGGSVNAWTGTGSVVNGRTSSFRRGACVGHRAG